MTDLYREVEDEVRRDRALALWKKYRVLIVAGVLIVVLAVVGFQGWRYYDEQQRGDQSERYSQALTLAQDGDVSTAITELAEMSDTSGGGYGLLAAFEEAKLKINAGDQDAAVAIWTEISEAKGNPPAFRDLATLLAVLHQIEQGDPASLRSKLDPLTAGGQPFRYSAMELLAVLALKGGNLSEARGYYGQIADDPTAPPSVGARAAQMQDALTEGTE